MAMTPADPDAMVEPHRDQAVAHMEETEHTVQHDGQPRPERRYRCLDCAWDDGGSEWRR